MPTQASAHDAFSRYVLGEVEVLYRVAWSLTHHDADAEDLVQDTLLRAFRSIDRFDGRYPRAWLCTIMRNAQINRVRRRRPGLLDDPDSIERYGPRDDHSDPAELIAEQTFDAVVDDAYRALGDEFRVVIDLVDLAGLSYADAAATLDIPEGTVMSRLHRARRRIRRTLAEAGFDRGTRT